VHVSALGIWADLATSKNLVFYAFWPLPVAGLRLFVLCLVWSCVVVVCVVVFPVVFLGWCVRVLWFGMVFGLFGFCFWSCFRVFLFFRRFVFSLWCWFWLFGFLRLLSVVLVVAVWWVGLVYV
jgi:hypothetical protein